MDGLISASKERIALAGLHGISVGAIFSYLEETNLAAAIGNFDDYVKAWLWKSLKKRRDMRFYQSKSDNPNLELVGAKTDSQFSSATDRGWIDPEREAVANLAAMELQDALALGEKLRISTTPDARAAALGYMEDSTKISDIQYGSLELIGNSLKKGFLQADLLHWFPKENPKSMFFHVKKLGAAGLMQRFNVVVKNGSQTVRTNRLVLTRFVDASGSAPTKEPDETAPAAGDDDDEPPAESEIPMNTVILRVCNKLNQARGATLRNMELMDYVNKMARMAHRSFWTSIRDELVQRGCIETFVAKSPNWGKPALCVRLVKMPSLEQQAKVNSYAAAQAGVIVAELPIDQQLYQIIEASGAEGYLQKDLRFPEIRRRHVEKLLEKFIKLGLITSTPTSIKKVLTNRLVAVRTKEPALAAANATHAIAAPTPKAAAPAVLVAPSDDDEAEERKQKKKRTTEQSVQRRAFILNLVTTKRIVFYKDVKGLLYDHEKSLSEDAIPADSKTVKNIVDNLEKCNQIAKMNVSVPMMTGADKLVQILLHPSVDPKSDEVSEFIQLARDDEFNTRVLTPMKQHPIKEIEHVDSLKSVNSSEPRLDDQITSYKIAVEYGFIKSKMKRSKLLHLHFWSIVTNTAIKQEDTSRSETTLMDPRAALVGFKGVSAPTQDVPMEVDGEEQTEFQELGRFRIADAVSAMPVAMYLQIIGQTARVEGLAEARDQGVLVKDLPDAIRSSLFSGRQFTRRLQGLVELLQAMHVVRRTMRTAEDLGTIPSTDLPSDVRLASQVLFMDTTTEEPTKRLVKTDSQAGVEEFWAAVEAVGTSKGSASIPEDPAERLRGHYLPPDVYSKANWSGLFAATAFQKSMLRRAYADLAEGSENYSIVTPAVEKFSKEVRMTPTQVLAYLHRRWARAVRLEETRSRKSLLDPSKRRKTPDDGFATPGKTSKSRKRRESDTPQQIDDGAIVDMLVTGQVSDPSNERSHVAFRIGQQAADIDTRRPSEDAEDVYEDEVAARPKRRIRWNQLDDVALLHQVTQMKADLLPENDDDPDVLHEGIDWGKIGTVVRKPAEATERRFHILMKWAPNQKFVQAAVLKLRRKKHEYKAMGIIQAPQAAAVPHASIVPLPISIQQFRDEYDITKSSAPTVAEPTAYTVLADFIKSILLLPEESYVAEAAYKALENFSAEEVSACYHLLQRHHLVVKRRTESSRPFGIASRLTHSLSLNCLIFEDFVSEYKVLRKSFDDAMMRDEGMSFEAGQNGAANAVALTALMLGKAVADVNVPDIVIAPRAKRRGGGRQLLRPEYNRMNTMFSQSNLPTPVIQIYAVRELGNTFVDAEMPDAVAATTIQPPSEGYQLDSAEANEGSEVSDEVIAAWLADCKQLHAAIANASRDGISLAKLLDAFSGSIESVQVKLDRMEALGLILQVSAFSGPLYLIDSATTRWEMPKFIQQAAEKGEGRPVVEFIEGSSKMSPWRVLDGSIATHLLPLFIRKLCSMILSRPGITEAAISQELQLFRPAATFEVLQFMILNGGVSFRCHYQRKPSLFSTLADTQPRPCTEEEYERNRGATSNQTTYFKSFFPNASIFETL